MMAGGNTDLPDVTLSPTGGKRVRPVVESRLDAQKSDPVFLKDLCRIFDICPRQLRRLYNELKLFLPMRRPGSARVVTCPPEEIARLAVHRFRRHKGFDREEAARVGCLQLLEAVAAEVEHEQAAADPARFGEVRVELMLELLLLGGSSPLARQVGLTDVETKHQLEAARSTVAELLRDLPGARASLAAALQSCLIALAVKRSGAAAERPPLANRKASISPAAFAAASGVHI